MLVTKKENRLVETDGLNFQVLVSFTETYEVDRSEDDFHGKHEFLDTELVNITLESVEVICSGRGIDILPKLTKKEKDAIIWELENC